MSTVLIILFVITVAVHVVLLFHRTWIINRVRKEGNELRDELKRERQERIAWQEQFKGPELPLRVIKNHLGLPTP
jgi:hypothetical protein